MAQDFVQFKKQMNPSYAGLLGDALGMVVDNPDKQSSAYQLFKAAMKTAQLAEISMNVIAETSNSALMGSRDVRNAISGGSAIVAAEVALKNGWAIGRGALAAVKLAAFMYADPKQANLMGFLEAQIASQGNAFADGGSTTRASAVVEAGPTDDTGSQLVGLMQQLVKVQREFRDEITDWPRSFEVTLDPRKTKKAVDLVTEIQSGGGIR